MTEQKVWEWYCISDHMCVYSEFDFVLTAKPKCFYNHVYLTFYSVSFVTVALGIEEDCFFCFFFSSLFFAGAFHVKDGRNVKRCQKQGSTLNSWQWRIVSLISATISSLFILSTFIFFTVRFSIFLLWYVDIVTVYYYLCILYLPSPPLCMNQTGPLGPSWDVTVSMCVCMPLRSVNHVTIQFSFQCHPLCVHRVWRIKKKNHASFCTRHVTSVSWNIIQSDGETFTVNVRQASIAVLTTVVSINGLLLSVFLLHCVDFVIWNKCPFSFCMFFTMLKVAAVALIIIR